jgi:16S rRNA (cytosine1402-N4)-methyltransferase
VLAKQVIDALTETLSLDSFDGWIVDGTLGAAGHSARLLEVLPRANLLGVDQDLEILEHARGTLAPYSDRVRVRHGRMSDLARTISKEQIGQPAAMLFDLGVSSLQLDAARRGFSFMSDGPLDMRMDTERERTAADIVNRWDESDLADLIFYEGGEHGARKVARAIVAARRNAPFMRTAGLADTIARALGGGGRIHPATRTFQALRRAVNEEGDELLRGLTAAEYWLAPGGRLGVITFHSGEDRAVKRFFADGAKAGTWDLVTRRPLGPDATEQRTNRRARSAKLRVAERTEQVGERVGASDDA